MAQNIVTVTTTADQGAGSLRAAIAAVQSGGTIRFASKLKGKTITLTNGQLDLNKNVTIDGSDAPGITISGNNANRVFRTGSGTNVVLKQLAIANGRVGGNNEQSDGGAGVQSGTDSTLTVLNCRFSNNASGFGGAIYAGFRATTTVKDSAFIGNDGTLAQSERGGGAIATKSGGSLTVKGSSFQNNRGINGGAINSLLGKLLVENSLFRGNDTTIGKATGGYGGAIYTDGANASGPNATPGATGGTITIRNTRILGNKGAGQGGGLFLFAYPPDQVRVTNSYIANNSVIPDSKGDGLGGGLRHGNAALTIQNTTFANNSATQQGGGLWVGEKSPVTISNSTFSGNNANDGNGSGLGGAILFANGSNLSSLTNVTVAYNKAGFQGGAFWGGGQYVTLKNSIVAFNTANNPWNAKVQTGETFREGGQNIMFPSPTDVKVTPNVRIVNPQLGALQNNGGFAPTHALLSGSPAINQGTGAPALDQRGAQRNGQADIGAVEFGAKALALNGTSSSDFLIGSSVKDSLAGSDGDDFLSGGRGGDHLRGGAGADYFMYAGTSQKRSLTQSALTAKDWIFDFNASQGDRVFIDSNDDLVSNRPNGLFNAGTVSGGTLKAAAIAAFADKNQKNSGQQALQVNEATVFNWNGKRYLSVNSGSSSFSETDDLVIGMPNMKFAGTDASGGVLKVTNYFA